MFILGVRDWGANRKVVPVNTQGVRDWGANRKVVPVNTHYPLWCLVAADVEETLVAWQHFYIVNVWSQQTPRRCL